jgi:N-acetylmuramoyl-L-alanine amidase
VENNLVKICLDAGHGGKDSGATGNGLEEKNLTLDIIKRINDLLKNYQNVETILTRDSDVFVELSERANIANRANADAFLSVHINAATATSARGYEDHIYTHVGDKTKAYQNVMHKEIFNTAYSGMEDRGKEQSDFAVVRETDMQAILTENLFITNSKDAAFLAQAANREKIAEGHVNGFVQYFGLKKKAEQNPPPAAGKLYHVQAGAFSEKKNATDLETDLKKHGYPAIVVKESDGLFHVQVGAFSKKSNADDLCEELKKQGYRAIVKYE